MSGNLFNKEYDAVNPFCNINFCKVYGDTDVEIFENRVNFNDEDSTINTTSLGVRLNEMVFCVAGNFHCQINNNLLYLGKNSVLLLPSHFKLTKCSASADAKVFKICFSSRISKFFNSLWNKAVYQNKNNITLSDADMVGVMSIWNIIKDKFKCDIDKYERKIIYMNLGIIFCKVLRYVDNQDSSTMPPKIEKKSYRANILFENFLDLLTSTTPKRHTVGFYASQLSVTANYLSVVCSNCSNKTVKDWIQEAVKEEVRFYLMHFNLSIKEVAEHSGFENLSFFTRYVKRNFGCTPTEYRKKYK